MINLDLMVYGFKFSTGLERREESIRIAVIVFLTGVLMDKTISFPIPLSFDLL